MSRSTRTTGFSFLAALFLSACGLLPNWVRGSGTTTTEARAVTDFTQVAVQGQGTAIITQGDEESLTIEAEDNLLPYLETTVQDGVLQLRTRAGILLAPTQPIIFHITLKTVTSLGVAGSGAITAASLDTTDLALNISGSGEITLEALTTDTLTNRISGAGTLTVHNLVAETVANAISGAGTFDLTGTTTEQTITISGNGTVQAAELQSETVQVTILGAGAVTVDASDTLAVKISGSGTVAYRGTPHITQHISGAGTVAALAETAK